MRDKELMWSLQRPQDSQVMVLRVLWVAFAATVFVYAGVGYVVAGGGTPAGAEFLGVLRIALVALSLTAAAVTFWWRRTLATSPGSPFFLFPHETATEESRPEAAALALQRLRVSCIAVWAMSEGVAVCGFLLNLLSRDPQEYVPFGAVALILFYLHRPGAWPIDRVMGRAEGLL